MRISCQDAGKRFNRDWIFRQFTFEFLQGNTYAITGPNGSGKSTLLQVLAGAMIRTTGNVFYYDEEKLLPEELVFQHVSIAAPYLEVVEEMTLVEFLSFHSRFKPFLPGLSINDIIEKIDLQKAADKQIRYYSSGMKQRVKLAQAIFSQTSFLFLDEPCTNFDETGFRLYHQLMEAYTRERLVVISSNDANEYGFANTVLNILDYK